MSVLARLALVLAIAHGAVACGDEQESTTEAAGESTSEHSAVAEAIGFGEVLGQIRGHRLVSLELYEAGDEKGAAVHAGHPIAEILDSVRSELEEHDPEIGEELATALEAGANAIADGAPAGDVSAAFDDAATLAEEALAAVVGEAADDASFKGSVIAALLSTAGHEYEEAVGAKGVRLAEFQDGYAFVREARRLYGDIAADVEGASAEEAEEIEEALETLEAALPSPKPPSELAEALDVTSAAELIGHELEETVGAAPVAESDPEEIVAEVERLLDEILTTYESGDAGAAAELSAEAFENYEVIEAEVIELAPEVNEELEPLLGADLRKCINDGAPISEVEDMVARAKELLQEALAAISEGH